MAGTVETRVETGRTPRYTNRRYLRQFLAVLALALGTSAALYASLDRYRTTPVNFYAMDDDDFVVTRGLTRMQNGGLKLGFIEHYPAPAVAVFGNHQFMFFGKDAFGPEATNRYFMNYWFENLGLPELYDYVSYVDSLGKLPTRLMLVQITTPNNDNGDNIINYNKELPEDLQHFAVLREPTDSLRSVVDKLHAHVRRVVVRTEKAFDYTPVLAATRQLLQGVGANTGRLVSLGNVSEDSLDLRAAFVSDGSLATAYYRDRPLALDENALTDKERHLKYGDEDQIADYMRKIAALGAARGVRVVFVIPPVYESDRPSIVNEIFSAALRQVPDVEVIDHRGRYRERPDFFARYDHPSKRYFEQLVRELRERGVVPPTAAAAPADAGEDGR